MGGKGSRACALPDEIVFLPGSLSFVVGPVGIARTAFDVLFIGRVSHVRTRASRCPFSLFMSARWCPFSFGHGPRLQRLRNGTYGTTRRTGPYTAGATAATWIEAPSHTPSSSSSSFIILIIILATVLAFTFLLIILPIWLLDVFWVDG